MTTLALESEPVTIDVRFSDDKIILDLLTDAL